MRPVALVEAVTKRVPLNTCALKCAADQPPCPRCNSSDTKFCYYNNYNISQPRYFCRTCQRYWTAGGTLRDVAPGAGRRKSKSVAAGAAAGATSAATKSDAPAKHSGGRAKAAAVTQQPQMALSLAPPNLGAASSLQLPLPHVGLPTMLPQMPPFLDPDLAAYGITTFPPPPLPIIDPNAMAAAAAVSNLGRQGDALVRAAANALLPDPASAFQPVAATANSVQGTASAGIQPSHQHSDSDGQGEADQRVKRLRTENGAVAAMAAIAAAISAGNREVPPPAQQLPQQKQPPQHPQLQQDPGMPPGGRQPLSGASDGLGLAIAGPLPSDWLSIAAATPQHAAQLQAVAAAGLAPNPYASVWPPYCSGAYGSPAAWPLPLPPGGPLPGGPPRPGCHPAASAADMAGMAVPPGSAPLGGHPSPLMPGMPPQLPVPWNQLPVAGGVMGGLGAWAQLPGGGAGGWGGAIPPLPAPIAHPAWATVQLPANGPIAGAATNLLGIPPAPPSMQLVNSALTNNSAHESQHV